LQSEIEVVKEKKKEHNEKHIYSYDKLLLLFVTNNQRCFHCFILQDWIVADLPK
jgi:hypothetical protein